MLPVSTCTFTTKYSVNDLQIIILPLLAIDRASIIKFWFISFLDIVLINNCKTLPMQCQSASCHLWQLVLVWARCPCANQLCVLLKIDPGWDLLHDFTLLYLVVKSFSTDGLSTEPSLDKRCLIWGLHTSVSIFPTFLPVILSSGFETISIVSGSNA